MFFFLDVGVWEQLCRLVGFILAAVQRKWLREDSGVAMWNDGGMVARGARIHNSEG